MQKVTDSIEFANKIGLAYGRACKPLCQKLGLPQTAFDILMFLANNPAYKTGWCRRACWSGAPCRRIAARPSWSAPKKPAPALNKGGRCSSSS